MGAEKKYGRVFANFLFLLIIAGFAAYFGRQLFRPTSTPTLNIGGSGGEEAALLRTVHSIQFEQPIESFVVADSLMAVLTGTLLSVLDSDGETIVQFAVEKGVRDIYMDNPTHQLYLLYPTRIVVINATDGSVIRKWEACSDNSDYVSLSLMADRLYVTDSANKNVCVYDTDGVFKQFINSPVGFVIPSYTFDVFGKNDTIYAVNSGKHRIERFSVDGKFLSAWGVTGGESGAFAGCCNPAYLIPTNDGSFITSEKGVPRIALYDKEGVHQKTLLAGKVLGGGATAYFIGMIGDTLVTARNNEVKFWAAQAGE